MDVDGTLVLSNDAHARSWVETFAKHGYDISFEQVRWLIGMGGDKLIPRLVPGLTKDSGAGKQISEYRSKLFKEKYASNLKPAPGSRDLVQKLLAGGFKLLIASSANSAELSTLLKAAEVDDLLEEATTSDDAERSKPEPDIIHAALDKIGLPAEKVIMIGDTPYDIEAAAQAGVGVIAVRCGGWKDEELSGAIAVYDDPADIAAKSEGIFPAL